MIRFLPVTYVYILFQRSRWIRLLFVARFSTFDQVRKVWAPSMARTLVYVLCNAYMLYVL